MTLRLRKSNAGRPRLGKEQGLRNSLAGIQMPAAASCNSPTATTHRGEGESGFSAGEPALDVLKGAQIFED